MEHETAAHHEEHPPTTIRQYILIGILLAIITAVELALTEALDLNFTFLVTLLLLLSGVKFAIVVALFMHLRFDSRHFTNVFVFGFVLAAVLLVALLVLFRTSDSNVIAQYATVPPAAAPGAPADGEPSDMVIGIPVAEYYAANCAVCHGQNREGGIGLPLTPAALTQADEVYFDAIKNGRAGTAMPPWGSTLNDGDINALVHWMTTVEP